MNKLKKFYNDGFGWKCTKCESKLKKQNNQREEKSRLMSEGEAESKSPELSNLALAKWADAEQKTLICPRCGIIEGVKN